MFGMTFEEFGWYAFVYGVVMKIFLHSTTTPPRDTLYGKVYRAAELTVMLSDKVKELPPKPPSGTRAP